MPSEWSVVADAGTPGLGKYFVKGDGRPDAEFPHDHQSGGNKLSLELTQQDHRALDSITQDEYKAFGWYFDSNK
eukprot:CAMPEP_0113550206 /NCGR_PEP_ID=MMETSP0015_2-20120614/13857_1 /TAXON_ID=2838 /ORGANISM="Odontella" /LENGTH=73 /DNA_ID=CAMNT_0000450995 /DNA_START=1152 /DNA_END=1377 /DNA_ORIENTATION=+ /assembly_acc=CAM_ASM_000160